MPALHAAGLTPEKIAEGDEDWVEFLPTEAQANAMLDVMFECVDFGEMMATEMYFASLTRPQVECIGTGMEMNPEFRAYWLSLMTRPVDEIDTTDDTVDLQSALKDIASRCGVDPSIVGG